MLKNITVLKRNNRIFNTTKFNIKYYNKFKVETIINIINNNNIIVKNILMQFESKTKTKKPKMQKIILKITIKTVFSTLKLIQLYEKQQKNKNIKIIRSFQLYKQQIKRKKLYNNRQIKLNQ